MWGDELMRALKRNMRPFWYCTYKGEAELIDENGLRTGEKVILYENPVEMKANISPATGQSSTEQFGNLENYDKVIVTCDMDCPITESTVLFVDREPEYTSVTSHDVVEAQALFGEDEINDKTYTLPKHDYIVRRVAKSLNGISIAIQKVTVS